MADIGLNIKVSANVREAAVALGGLNDNLVELATDGTVNIQSVSLALQDLRNAAREAGNTKDLALFNRAIKDLSTEMKSLKQVGLKDDLGSLGNSVETTGKKFGVLGLNLQQSRVAFTDIGRIVDGQGFTLRNFASNFALIGPVGAIVSAALYGVFEILNKTTDEEKRAAKNAEELKKTLLDLKTVDDIHDIGTGSEAGNIERVKALAAVIEDTNRAYKDRQNALEELQKTNKAYFGDLTLEAASLLTLKKRVDDYANALITEAIIKGQVSEISKLSEEYNKQSRVLQELGNNYQAANEEYERLNATNKDENWQGVRNNVVQAANASDQAKNAWLKQNDAVATLRDQITKLTDDLRSSINEQVKLKPLDETIKKPKDAINGVEELLQKIKQAKDELNKKDVRPIFERVFDAQNADSGSTLAALFQSKIAKAIEEGNKIGTDDSKKYARILADLYEQELTKVRNPITSARVQGIVDVKPGDAAKLESQIEKSLGGQLKVRIPFDIKKSFENEGFDKESSKILLQSITEDALNNLPPIRWNPDIQIKVDRKRLQEELSKNLVDGINEDIKNAFKGGLTNLGEAIGNAISTGKNPLQVAGQAILQTFGDLIEQVGKALIEYGTMLTGVQSILSAGLELPGFAAIAIGIATVAAGAVLKSAFKPKAFAEGGLVTGPTYSLIGEAGPEVVFPLNKLNDFVRQLQPAGQNVSLSGGFRLQGQDLILAVSRAQKNKGLV